MKRRLAAAVLTLVLLLALPGCREREEKVGWKLYFLAGDFSQGEQFGSAFAAETFDPALCTQKHREGESCPTPCCLLTALLAGPQREGLQSPFPKGVTLKNWAWAGEREGNLRVVLSEQYGGLTDIALTLADYSIVLTLSQLPGVESVEIQTSGASSGYRSHQVLQTKEAVLGQLLP